MSNARNTFNANKLLDKQKPYGHNLNVHGKNRNLNPATLKKCENHKMEICIAYDCIFVLVNYDVCALASSRWRKKQQINVYPV